MGRTVPTIIPGTRYGHLITTGFYIPSSRNSNKSSHALVECKCDCGIISYKQLGNLKHKGTKTCSFKCHFNMYPGNATTHGLSLDKYKNLSKEYRAWRSMIYRCDNTKSHGFEYTGGKGISYHESLSTIEGFWKVMGKAPSKYHRFARIDKDGDFEPGNVHWYLAA